MKDLIAAIIAGILYFFGQAELGYHVGMALGSPLMVGFAMGLIYGDVASGLIIGGTIQLIYLGVIYTGGNKPSDDRLAGAIVVPIALKTGMDPSLAVSLAVPFAVLGVFLDQIRRTSNSIWVSKADACAEKGDLKGMARCQWLYPLLVAVCIRFVPVFTINLLGTEAIQGLVAALPEFIINGLRVAGGVLPAMGFAIILVTIGRKDLMPFFFIGFFAVAYLGINTMAAAIFGACIAILVVSMNKKKTVEEEE